MNDVRLNNVQFHNGGYCQQFEFFTGVRSLRWRRFQAVFVSFEHPTHGLCFIDCGYGPAMVAQTRRFPARLFRFTTPMSFAQPCMQPTYQIAMANRLSKSGKIFVSHFHADHIGGMQQFEKGQFVIRNQAWQTLQQLTRWQQVRQGFIEGLLAADFSSRIEGVDDSQFNCESSPLPGLAAIDYWQDGSLWLIDLPGHALGHTGYLLRSVDGDVLYVVDAFWDARTYEAKRMLPLPARQIHHSYKHYEETLEKLRSALAKRPLVPYACHCPRTQQLGADG